MFFNIRKENKEKELAEKREKLDFLLIGLGNPGEKYKKTAHNAGFRTVSLLREKLGLPSFKKDNILKSFLSKGVVEDKKIALLLPLTFMNLSGEAVKKAVSRFDIPTPNLILVHDDTDLLLGTLRFSFSKNSAGHKGVASIIKSLKTKRFFRLRIGVRKDIPTRTSEKSIKIVLKNLPQSSKKVEEKASEELEKVVKEGPTKKTVHI